MEMKHLKNDDDDTDERTHLQATYGSVNLPIKRSTRDLNNWDVLIFTFIFWNIYLSRKLLYPFSKEFADFYGVPITSFSFVLSAFDIGGSASVLLTLLPSLHHIHIRLLMFLLVIALSAFYLLAAFCYELTLIFVVRMGMGFISNTVSSEIRGVLSVFTKDSESTTSSGAGATAESEREHGQSSASENKLAMFILFAETSWFTSSAGWILIGVILQRLNVDYVWYFGSLCALITAMVCYFLPRFTVSDILNKKNSIDLLDEDSAQSTSSHRNETVWTQYHLYWFFVGQFLYIFGYCAFVATFGPFMQSAYGLNAEQLGFQTVFISVAEGLALVVCSFTAKYKTNLWRAIMSAIITVTAATIFAIALWVGEVPIVAVWVMLFVYTLWMEHAHLNCIVCVLEMTPHGLESKSALLGQFSTSVASIAGLIIGPHVVVWYGFPMLMRMLVVAQLLAVIMWFVSRNIFNAKQEAKKSLIPV